MPDPQAAVRARLERCRCGHRRLHHASEEVGFMCLAFECSCPVFRTAARVRLRGRWFQHVDSAPDQG